ncbi:DgyrCDS145 [Dimorphilus gyrociliatus]|uniref:DgyrCDS145 n=1 Tax=Dimorphilus gyrociliatus TaxID=2664684 RepID=A0A7I8V589_9ANNE|nr:DgyrCDS145 [Dimorphilus gyrociliatus]
MSSLILSARLEDEDRRKELRSLLEELLATLEDVDESVQRELIEENIIRNSLKEDFKRVTQTLTRHACVLVVSGSNSPCSTNIVNKLLTTEVLPTSLPPTYTIRFGEKPSARIITEEGRVYEIDALDIPCAQQLAISMLDIPGNLRALDICIPNDLLELKVTIASMPPQDRLLENYLADHDLFAFVYVSADSPSEDKHLEGLLDRINEPRASVIVYMSEEDDSKVSEKEAMSLQAEHFITASSSHLTDEEILQICNKVDEAAKSALRTRTEVVFEWLERMTNRALHIVAAHVAWDEMNTLELRERHHALSMSLERIERDADKTISELEKTLDEEIRIATMNLVSYLNNSNTHAKMSMWSKDHLPYTQHSDLWPNVETKLHGHVEQRIANVLREWDERTQLLRKIYSRIRDSCREKLMPIESQLANTTKVLEGDMPTLLSVNDEDVTRTINVSELSRPTKSTSFPLIKKLRQRGDFLSYCRDREKYMRDYSMKMLETISNECIVTKYVEDQLQILRQTLSNARAIIPHIIHDTRRVMHSLAADRRKCAEITSRHKCINALAPLLKEKIAKFANQYVRKYDIDSESVIIGNICGKSTWSLLKEGSWNGAECTVKLYTGNVSARHIASEEHILKRVKHPYVAFLLGSLPVENAPALLIEQHLKSARSFAWRRRVPKAGRIHTLSVGRRILEQTSLALEFLHTKKLVHIEVRLDSIMIDAQSNKVQLCHLGSARPIDIKEGENVSVYLAPEVIRGGTYTSPADVYGIALAAYELWHNTIVTDIDTVKAELNNDTSDFLDCPYRDLIKRSLIEDKNCRPVIGEWIDAVRSPLSFEEDSDKESD